MALYSVTFHPTCIEIRALDRSTGKSIIVIVIIVVFVNDIVDPEK